MEPRFIYELDSPGRVILRCDYNVPLRNGSIQDNYRIRKSIPTIRALLDKGASQLVILTHIGRPKGKDPALSTAPVAEELQSLLAEPVLHIPTPTPNPKKLPSVDKARVLLLENVRYRSGEVYNEQQYAKQLARLGDVYVNDAFGVSHRKHASVSAITHFLPTYLGLLMKQELEIHEELAGAKGNIDVILGGAKLKSKLGVIREIAPKTRNFYLGGAMIFPFYAAEGLGVGKAQFDESAVETSKALKKDVDLVLPSDVVVADDMKKPRKIREVTVDKIPSDMYALDIGRKSTDAIIAGVKQADYIVWNGPLGYYENPVFAKATKRVLEALTEHSGKVIIGGGDTGALVHEVASDSAFYHVSTGGGAFLELLETGTLPILK